MRRKDWRKNRARGEGRRGERRDKAVKVKKKDENEEGDSSRWGSVLRHTRMDLLRSNTRPNTVWSRSSVLQFQRWCLNWCWHSLIHSLVPSPMACMMSGWRWQSCRCLFTKPGMLSQITRAPSAPMYLKIQNKAQETLGGFQQNPPNIQSHAKYSID